MDPDVELMFVAHNQKFMPRENVAVKLCQSFDRKIFTTEAKYTENDIQNVWQERLRHNNKLWNGTKFRLSDVITAENNKVVFHLGITDYKDFIGTNWSPRAAEIHQMGVTACNNKHAFMSDALGVGSLVKTADNKFILLKRSTACGEAQGLYDIPGGHPEPKEILGKVPKESVVLTDISEAEVVAEIFDSTLREISDEVNIPLSTLADPLLMGIARNTTSAGRPSSEYYVECSLKSDTILQRYMKGVHSEAEESTELLFLPMSSISELQKETKIWNLLAPSAKGCIILYQMKLFQDNHLQTK